MRSLKIELVDKRKTEFVTALYCMLWGVWLLLPWDSFSSSSVFIIMSRIAPECAWGALSFIIGIFHISVLLANKTKLSLVSSLATIFFFAALLILTALGNFKATAVVTYLVLLVCAWGSYVELLLIIKKKA